MKKPNLQTILVSILIIVALFSSIYLPYKWKQLSNDFLDQTNQYGELLKQINDLQKEARELKNGEGEIEELKDWKVYRNEEYGFEITLIDSWKGFSTITESWQGTTLDGNSIQFQGPKILLRNPNWTEIKPYWQDIPILIFTKQEWQLIETENLSIFAAPISPIKLGENQQYVFALPPRWVGFSDTLGQDEAKQIAETFKAFQIKDEIADWKTYRNEEYGFEVKYPEDWKFLEPFNQYSFRFGQEKNIGTPGYDGEWFIFVFNKSEKTVANIIKDIGDQFGTNRKEERENIIINNIPALKVLVTTSSIPDWHYESIIIKQQEKIYWIHNGAVKNTFFDEFYSSFKFIETDKTLNWKTYKKDIFTLKYPSEIWNLKDERLFHKKIGDSCAIIPGGLWRQSLIKIVESIDTNFNGYEARQVKLGSNKDEVSIINVYFDANLPGKEFRLYLPKDKQDKQICEDDFKEALSTIKFEK